MSPVSDATGPSPRHGLRADREATVDAMARGFEDDPFMRWIFPHDHRRLDDLRRLMDIYFASSLRKGNAWLYTDHSGGAMWSPPDVEHLDESDLQGWLTTVNEHDPGRAEMVMGGLMQFVEFTQDEPHWYLAAVSLSPETQGRGLGGPLLEPVLSICDQEQVAAYLECSKPRNVGFYQRHGFEVMGEVELPDGPTVPMMWREPRG
jgi:ribosomal protein S18 acetylase RimI-like enzyme